MTLDEVLALLRSAELELRARGVRHAGVFGSTARGDNRPDSDVDVLVDFEPAAHVTIYDYVFHQERYRQALAARRRRDR